MNRIDYQRNGKKAHVKTEISKTTNLVQADLSITFWVNFHLQNRWIRLGYMTHELGHVIFKVSFVTMTIITVNNPLNALKLSTLLTLVKPLISQPHLEQGREIFWCSYFGHVHLRRFDQSGTCTLHLKERNTNKHLPFSTDIEKSLNSALCFTKNFKTN